MTKTNKNGKVKARMWWKVNGERVGEAQKLMPVPYDRSKDLTKARKELLKSHGIDTTYSARRDALTMAEAEGIDPAKVAAHKPGSKRTAEYINSLVPTGVQEAMGRTLTS